MDVYNSGGYHIVKRSCVKAGQICHGDKEGMKKLNSIGITDLQHEDRDAKAKVCNKLCPQC